MPQDDAPTQQIWNGIGWRHGDPTCVPESGCILTAGAIPSAVCTIQPNTPPLASTTTGARKSFPPEIQTLSGVSGIHSSMLRARDPVFRRNPRTNCW